MIYIVNSARDSLVRHVSRDLALGRHVLLICDESHYYQSRENRRIFGFLKDLKDMRGSMGKKTRAKSYVQLQSFFKPSPRLENTFSLFAFSSSFVEDVIDKKKEMENVQEIYAEDPAALAAATATLNMILNAPELAPLTKEEILQILLSIQDFHGGVYGWKPKVTADSIYAATETVDCLLRTKIHAVIEFFDQLYQYGEAGKTKITELGKESFDEEDTPELPGLEDL